MATVNDILLLTADAISVINQFGAPQWGIFFNGIPVIFADSVVSFEFNQDYRISDYQVEQGAFETYNKVQDPFDVKVRYSAGGSALNRQAFQVSVDAIMPSLDIFDVVTPEKVFLSVNPTHQNLRRTANNGVGLLQIDVWCEQVRVTAQTQFTNTQSPNGQSPQNGGLVQAQPAGAADFAYLPLVT